MLRRETNRVSMQSLSKLKSFRPILGGCILATIIMGTFPIVGSASASERVLLQAFVVDAVSRDHKRIDRVPITVTMQVKNETRGNYICKLAPKVIDSILIELSKKRFERSPDGALVFAGVNEQLKPIVTSALRWDIVDRIIFKEGAPKIASSSAQLFARTGCMISTSVDSKGKVKK